MRTIRSASTRRSGFGRRTKRAGVLATLAVLAAVSGALMQSRSGASATAASRQPRTTVAAAQANTSRFGRDPGASRSGQRDGGSLRGLARVPGRALSRHVLRRDRALHRLEQHLRRHRHVRLAEQDGRRRCGAPSSGSPRVLGERVHALHGRGRAPQPPVLRPLHHRHRAGHRDLPRRRDPRLPGRDPDRPVLGGGLGPPRRHLPTACSGRSCLCDLRERRPPRSSLPAVGSPGSCPA